MEYGLIKDTTLQTMADGFREKGIVPKTDPVYEQLDYIKYASANATSLDDPTPVDTSGGDTTYETIDVSIPEATSLEFVFHIGYYSVDKSFAGYLRVKSGSYNAFSESATGSGGSKTVTARIDPYYGNTMQVRLEPTAATNTAFAVTFEVYPLDADGNYMQITREVGVSTHKVTPEEMAEAIANFAMPIAPPEEAFTITGSCANRFSRNNWNWFLDYYSDVITSSNINNLESAFHYSNQIISLPFTLNVNNISAMDNAFREAGFKECPKIRGTLFNGTGLSLSSILYSCSNLRNVDDLFTLDMLSHLETVKIISAYTSPKLGNLFCGCTSLRSLPNWFYKLRLNPESTVYPTSSYTIYYYTFSNDYNLDEIVDLLVWRCQGAQTSNMFNYTFSDCSRIKSLTFETDNGQPIVTQWKGQTIDLTGYIGFNITKAYFLNYNSGITADKEVKDDATYQALKNDPDWFATKLDYCRYNHDSAVETINSLPDTSAYLATAGGTNTIKFKSAAGAKTDGGAINTLTAEEIAVAAAKADSNVSIRRINMKSTNFNIVRYDADEGMVFDWKEPRFVENEEGEQVQEHLYAKTLFIGPTDSIDNYIEVEEV